MAKDTFAEIQQQYADVRRNVTGSPGRMILCGVDERGYFVFLQKTPDEREPMVRVGCRYFTLKDARKHWVSKGRNYSRESRRSAAQILAAIAVGVHRGKRDGWVARTVKFNSTPRR